MEYYHPYIRHKIAELLFLFHIPIFLNSGKLLLPVCYRIEIISSYSLLSSTLSIFVASKKVEPLSISKSRLG